MALTHNHIFVDSKRLGCYESGVYSVPVGTTRVGVSIERKNWNHHASGDKLPVIELSVEVSIDGGSKWVLVGGAASFAGDILDRKGNPITETSFSARLQREFIGIEGLLARATVNHLTEGGGKVDLFFDDAPIPPIPVDEHHSVTYDNDGENAGQGVSSVTIGAFAVGNNSDRYMIVGQAAWTSVDADSTVSSISHNGSTSGWGQIVSIVSNSPSGNRASLWGKKMPDVVTATVICTCVGNVTELGFNALSVYGVSQTTPYGTPVSSIEGTDNTPTVTVSDAANDDMIYDAFYVAATGIGCTVGADQTQRANIGISSPAFSKLAASTQSGSISDHVMSWSLTNTGGGYQWLGVAVALKSASAAVTGPFPTFRPDVP